MSKTRLFRESVRAALREASGIPMHHRIALPGTKMPYGVFLLDLTTKEEVVELYDLTVDVCNYDLKGTDDGLDDICDRICHNLDYYCHIDENQAWEAYLSSRNVVEESDKNIQRRRLSFTLRYVERTEAE